MRTSSKRKIRRKPLSHKNIKQQAAKRCGTLTHSYSREQVLKSKLKPTGRPSDAWASYDGARSKTHADKIRRVFKTGNWKYLRREAVKHHQRRAVAQGKPVDSGLSCEISHTRFASGASNVVLEVMFSDLTYWIVRIRLPQDGERDQEIEKEMHSEVATMRLIQERTSVPVATIFGYDSDQNNPFGYRYMFMSSMPGRHLDQPFSISVQTEQRIKVAEQLADILHQIGTKLTFEKIGWIWRGELGDEEPSIIAFNACGVSDGRLGHFPIGPCSTSVEYFYTLRQGENAAIETAIHGEFRKVLGQDPDEDWLTACRVFDHALCSLVLKENLYGPFPLKHPDFHYNNILLDDNFNITGILDWTGAQTVPCESFAVGTEFIVPPMMSGKASITEFRDMVKCAWQKRQSDQHHSDQHHSKSPWSMSDMIGSSMGDLIHFSYTLGALRRTVAYARIVVSLLYGNGFTLETFKRNDEAG